MSELNKLLKALKALSSDATITAQEKEGISNISKIYYQLGLLVSLKVEIGELYRSLVVYRGNNDYTPIIDQLVNFRKKVGATLTHHFIEGIRDNILCVSMIDVFLS